MKKQLLTLISLSAILFGCGKSNEVETMTPAEKKLVSIEAIMTPYKFGAPSTTDQYRWAKQEFNESGQITLSSYRVGINDLDPTKSYDNITRFTYVAGKLTEKKDDTYRYVINYNGNDTLSIARYGSTGLSDIDKYEYNSSGKKVKVNNYSSDNTLFETRTYAYNSTGLNSTIDIFYKPFITGNQLQYTYDNAGKMLTETYLNREKGTSTIQKQAKYIYDASGRILEYTRSSYYTIIYRKLSYTYDDKNQLIKQDLFESNNINTGFEQKGTINYIYTYK
jgi:hypothetical protein